MCAALRLHYNENTAGCSPAVMAALGAMTRADVSTYPDYASITRRVETWFGVEPGGVLLTNGLDEGLQIATQYAVWHMNDVRAANGRDGATRAEVVIVEPAFETYALCADAARATIVRVAPNADFSFPIDRVLAAASPATRLIHVTDPNNPTGLPLPAGAVETIASAVPHAIVLVDEAYADFSGRTSIGPLLARHPNVVVGRTFAKAHGLAALRVGALVADRATLDRMRPLVLPFTVNAFAMRALDAALDDRAYVPWYVEEAAASRELIYAWCDRHTIEYWPSAANFVLIRAGDRAPAIAHALADRGVLVRDKSAAPGCAGCLRLTAGLVEDTRAALAALEETLAPRTH